MYVAVRTDGKLWDGKGWGKRGKVFLSTAKITRSLHEQGEDIEYTKISLLEA